LNKNYFKKEIGRKHVAKKFRVSVMIARKPKFKYWEVHGYILNIVGVVRVP